MLAVKRLFQNNTRPPFSCWNKILVQSTAARSITTGQVNLANVHTPELKFRERKKEFGPIAWFLLLVPITTFGLGTWQVKRKKWKEELIEGLMVKVKLPPIDLPSEENEVKQLEYRRVTVQGEFEHDKEMWLGPRSCLTEGQSSANQGKLFSKSADGISGYLVITPFILTNTNERILVNRGWVPFSHKQAGKRREGQVKGEVQLTGVVRLTEPRPPFTPLNKIDARVWFCRDVEAMASVVDARPVFLDAVADSTVHGGPIGGQTRASLRNEHFSYILTWYSLSGATALMWYQRFMRR